MMAKKILDTYILTIRADGAARGNPGPAGIGCVLEDENGILLEKFSEYIGETTNNVAEYTAVLFGLKEAAGFNPTGIRIISDSQLLVRQLQGLYKVKSENLKQAHQAVLEELSNYGEVVLLHVPRHENAMADELANRAIDDFNDGLRHEVLKPQSLWSQDSLF